MTIVRLEKMEKTIKVGGMHCNGCEFVLKDTIEGISGIKEVRADHKKGTVTIKYESEKNVAETKKAIESEGYKVIG